MSHSLSLSKRIVPNFIFPMVILLVLSACGQKGDLYLPNIPPSPNVMNDGQENELTSTSEGLTDQDESSETKKNESTSQSKESLPVPVTE